MAIRDWCFAFLIHPPIVKGPIRVDEEPLFWWWGFGKCIREVCAIDEHVFSRGDGIEYLRSRSVNTIGVCVVQDLHLSGVRKPVANATSFLSSVKFFYDIRPDKVKNSRVILFNNWFAKHKLLIILVKLQVF
jgi:hypothetical protein